MKSEQTVKLKINLAGLYDVLVENKKGEITTASNLSFPVAIKFIEDQLYKGEQNAKRNKLP